MLEPGGQAFSARALRIFAITRSTISSETSEGKSKDLLSVTIFKVFNVES